MRTPIMIVAAAIFVAAGTVSAQAVKPRSAEALDDRMSSMGQLARQAIQAAIYGTAAARALVPGAGVGDCADGNTRCTPSGPTVGAGATQSEVSIAVDSTGQNIVIGFNDFRGFFNNPVSTSGYMYSNDGGHTFVDGGQLPSPGNQVAFGQRWPQIFGDPDVEWLGGCNFIYSSLMIKVAGPGLVQTLAIHRSNDCGRTWNGPIEVTPATNPNALVDVGGNPLDVADKELMDVDPDTGRVLIGWANFTPAAAGGVEISTTYTDDVLAPNPVFAPRRVVASAPGDGQGATVQFAGNGSPNVFIAWERFPGPYIARIAFSRSTDNGQTWSPPVEVAGNFLRMDQVLGNDRVNEYPSISVDNSSGPNKGNIYLTYSNNNSLDGADVAVQRSTDGGLTFSPAILVNSRPGNDRAQWFPFVTTDRTTGRIYIFYYDQGIASSGHLTQVTYLASDDGGVTWTAPAQLSDEPFKAGWGNDTSQPNLGDYNHAVARSALLFSAYAVTRPTTFAAGQPSVFLPPPDVQFNKVPGTEIRLPLMLGTLSFTGTGADGSIDPGETVSLRLSLVNNTTNPLHARTLTGISAVLSSTTPGVTILQPSSAYPDLAPGASANNTTNFSLRLSPTYLPGTPVQLQLAVAANGGATNLIQTLSTGTPLHTTLVSENFDAVPPGALPAGWQSVHGAGPNVVPWITSNSFCGPSNKAFHQNANDGPPNQNTRWERLFSPAFIVPGDSHSVEVEFDVCYDTEDDPFLRVLAYDGFFLRVTDLTPGRTPRSVLVEAFEREFTTGPIQHYPKHFPRNSNPAYFEDMSAWAGDSGGVRHVRMLLPGMAGSTAQLRFEFTQDAVFDCTAVRPGRTCGVAIDNLVVRSVRNVVPNAVNLVVRSQLLREATTNALVATVTVSNEGTATASGARLTTAVLGSTATTTSPLPVLGNIAPGASVSVTLRFPPAAAAAGTQTLLRINGSYQGGTFGGSSRITAP